MEEVERTEIYTEEPLEKEATDEEVITEDTSEASEKEEMGVTDYARLAREDMETLISLFPHLSGKESITELKNPLRYAALRDLGLSPKEAFLATEEPTIHYDNRSHLTGFVPRRASAPENMLSAKELESARMLFSGLSDREIHKLYKKVTR